jgi:hypothetical protein
VFPILRRAVTAMQHLPINSWLSVTRADSDPECSEE